MVVEVVVEHSSGLETRKLCFHKGLFRMVRVVRRTVSGVTAHQELLHLGRMKHAASHLLRLGLCYKFHTCHKNLGQELMGRHIVDKYDSTCELNSSRYYSLN